MLLNLIQFFTLLIDIYSFAIIGYIILGYFPETRGSKIYEILRNACEPFLKIFDFATVSGISFAPLIGITVLEVLKFLIREIYL